MLIDAPNAIFIPPLRAGRAAVVAWPEAEGAAGYQLECSFDESFDSALRSMTWQQLDAQGWAFGQVDDSPLWESWNGFERIPPRGLDWRQAERRGLTWETFGDKNLEWQDVEALPFDFTVYKGPGQDVSAPGQAQAWQALDGLNHTWNEWAAEVSSWAGFGQRPAYAQGLCWYGLESRFLSWAKLEEPQYSWAAFESLPADNQALKGCEVAMPEGCARAFFRLRAYDAQGRCSEYYSADGRGVASIETLEAKLAGGGRLTAPIAGAQVANFAGSVFMLRYDEARLRLKDTMFEAGGETCRPAAKPRVLRCAGGELRFECERDNAGARWSGLVLLPDFAAVQGGKAQITLERVRQGM